MCIFFWFFIKFDKDNNKELWDLKDRQPKSLQEREGAFIIHDEEEEREVNDNEMGDDIENPEREDGLDEVEEEDDDMNNDEEKDEIAEELGQTYTLKGEDGEDIDDDDNEDGE